MKKIISCLDWGSSNIKLIVAQIHNEKLYILASACVKSKGIKKGLIVDKELAKASIKEAFDKIESIIERPLKKVVCTVPPLFCDFIMSEGTTSLDRENGYINGDDILRAFQACVYNKVRSNMEFVNICPLEFIIDDSKVVEDPKGLAANKLTVKAIVSLTEKNNIGPLFEILNELNVEVADICLTGLADYYEYIDDMKNEYKAVINIGGDLTTISVLNKNVLIGTTIIESGGKSVDKDIAYEYDISLKGASYIKEKFGIAFPSLASTKENIPYLTKSKENIKINQYELSKIIYNKFKEILELSKKEINYLTKKEISYIIVTGGSSELNGFNELLNEVYGSKVKVSNVFELGVRNNMFSSSLGLIKYYNSKLKFRNKIASTFTQEEEEQLFTIKKKINNDSMIGKIYGYFFDN